MASKQLGADVNLAWPTAQIAVMGASGAVNILQRKALAAVGEAGGDVEAERARLVAEYDEEIVNPYDAADRGYVDAVIEPSRDARPDRTCAPSPSHQARRPATQEAREHPAVTRARPEEPDAGGGHGRDLHRARDRGRRRVGRAGRWNGRCGHGSWDGRGHDLPHLGLDGPKPLDAGTPDRRARPRRRGLATLAAVISPSRIRTRYRWLVAAVVLVPAVVGGPWLYVRIATIGDIYGPGEIPHHADAALVLGAKVGDDGLPSVFLQERVDLGIDLYERGIVDVIVMTGATRLDGYDEPATMRDLALAKGVPAEAIILDREGVDTFASCANAAGPLDLDSVVVITQEFHVARATWLCQRAGVDAEGAYPPIGRRAGTVTGNIREIAATWKAVLNVVDGRE